MEVLMRGIVLAIGKALAAMAATVIVWCEQLGRFIVKCLPGYQLPGPLEVVEAYDQAAAEATVEPTLDKKIAGIQQAAECLFRQQPPAPDMVEGLSPKTMTCLGTLNGDMLLGEPRGTPQDLREHLALRQQTRGLRRDQDDPTAAYRAAMEPELERLRRCPSPRRKPDDEPFSLPAFDPIC